MKYYLWLVVFLCFFTNGMEQKENMPEATGVEQVKLVMHEDQDDQEAGPEIKYECEGSWEQSCGYCLSCTALGAAEPYIFSRITPYWHPINPGLFGAHELTPEQEQLLLLAPLCCMLGCASNKKPDHSCCVGKCQLCGLRVKEFIHSLCAQRLSKKDYGDLELAALDDAPGVPVTLFMGATDKKKND